MGHHAKSQRRCSECNSTWRRDLHVGKIICRGKVLPRTLYIKQNEIRWTKLIHSIVSLSASHFGPLAPIENARLKLGSLFTIGPTEANTQAREQGPQKKAKIAIKAQRGNRKSRQTTSPKITEAGIVALFIIGSLDRQKESGAADLALKYQRESPGEPFLSYLPSRSLGNPTQLAPHEKATLINRYSPDKPDCQSGLPVDPTAPIRGYIEAEEAAMTRESQGKPSTPLLKRVAESFHWLLRVTDGLLFPI
ncbi:hypothetical protein CRG98_007653 [Punica granatum]|uniref:Uncharacterized protein n=1 Tax=Punica granatum TaxID=22663 RepID=A0A2I0KUG5_PUNGR|nr:hypothetical protein CRG98_007653 [Punica granatum]